MYELQEESHCRHLKVRYRTNFEQEVVDIQANIEGGFTLKCVCDMPKTYNKELKQTLSFF